jgi:hypothetical protein
MMHETLEWLERVQAARQPGTKASVKAWRGDYDVGWRFELADRTDIPSLAAQIESMCAMTGLSNHDFLAYDAKGAAIGPPRYRLRPPPSDDPEAALPQMGSSLPRHFLVLAFRTMLEMQRQSTKIIVDLHEQNAGLRAELGRRRASSRR